MATNYRETGQRVEVNAAAARNSGALVWESGLVGVAINNADQTVEGVVYAARYPLALMGVWDVPLVEGAAKGNQVSIISTGANTVAVAAPGTDLGDDYVYVGRVVGIPGDSLSAVATDAEPAAGYMSVLLAGYCVP
jgi:predicted RecA/RadA family phage recombinase